MEKLRPLLRAGYESSREPSRIVNVASRYAGDLSLRDVHFQRRSYDVNAAYRQSKQANRMLSAIAASIYAPENIVVNSGTVPPC